VRYVIDPYQLTEFEAYAKAWLGIVERLGGTHHGYFLPSEARAISPIACSAFLRWPITKATGTSR
jgi:hypothetical protein